MNTDRHGLRHEEQTERIIKVFYDVYNELGHGFLESVYERAMEIALIQEGMAVQRQVKLRVMLRGQSAGEFIADMLINGCVMLKLKSTAHLDRSHEAQVLNQLRATEIEVGLLCNFGTRAEFKRLIFTNDRKTGFKP
ncbi:MAG: GxxExxY protein [Phycisphaerales bacterium]|nr:GxxExxY protein [Phycisphaerales bacterium]